MSLSDDIHLKMKGAEEGFILTIKVKQAVKELKEEFKSSGDSPREIMTSIYNVYRIREIIDKIFGEKLT